MHMFIYIYDDIYMRMHLRTKHPAEGQACLFRFGIAPVSVCMYVYVYLEV